MFVAYFQFERDCQFSYTILFFRFLSSVVMIAYLISCAMSCIKKSSSSDGFNGGFGGSWVNSDGQVTSTSGTFENAGVQEVLGKEFRLCLIKCSSHKYSCYS